MSLIIDALKRAQQLRSSGTETSTFSSYPFPNKKRGSKKHWVPVGAGLISLCIILFVFMRPASSPQATQTNRAVVPTETKPPVAEKIASESAEKVWSHPKVDRPLLATEARKPAESRARSQQPINRESSSARTAPTDLPARPEREKKPAETNRDFAPSPPLAAQKEEIPRKPIGVEQEGGKDGTLASDVLYHFNLGVTLYNQKEFPKAIQAYQKVIELDPTYVEAYNNLGIIYQMMGDADRASGAYEKATEINPKYGKGYNNLGILLLLKGRYDEAEEAFQKALAINPNNIQSHINLGILFKKKSRWEDAIESYQKALTIDPLHRETHYNIALLYEQLENVELAIAHYQQFIRLSPKSHSELVSRVRRHLNGLIDARKNKSR